MQDDTVDPAQQLLVNERTRWPRWRNSALKATPMWFHGQELDVIGAEERRSLFHDVSSTFPRVQWTRLVLPVCWLPLWLRRVSLVDAHRLEVIGAVLFIGVLVGTTWLRRRNVVMKARRVLRERADWPQRLDKWRS